MKELRCDSKLLNLICSAIDAASDETGWVLLSAVGNYISKTVNDFDPRNYGFSKLNGLITAMGLFEIERKENQIFVRQIRKKNVKDSTIDELVKSRFLAVFMAITH